MPKKKIVAPFLKPAAILGIALSISATTAVVDSKNFKAPKEPKTEETITTESSVIQKETPPTSDEEMPSKNKTEQSSEPEENALDKTKDTEQEKEDNNRPNPNVTPPAKDTDKQPSGDVNSEAPVEEQPTEESKSPDINDAAPQKDADLATGGDK